MLLKLIKIISLLAVFSLIINVFAACERNNQRKQRAQDEQKLNKDSIESINRRLVAQEKKAIKKYIEDNNLNVVETGTGLCYCIVNQGDGESIKAGNVVALDYKVKLLNGKLIYSSEESGYKVFVVGHGGVESGLEEAILHLHKGDEAEIIIPSHLAYGLLGDGNMIPPRSTIVYNIKVIENQLNK